MIPTSALDLSQLTALLVALVAVFRPALDHPRSMTSAEKARLISTLLGALIVPIAELSVKGAIIAGFTLVPAIEQGLLLGAGVTYGYKAVQIGVGAIQSSKAPAQPAA